MAAWFNFRAIVDCQLFDHRIYILIHVSFVLSTYVLLKNCLFRYKTSKRTLKCQQFRFESVAVLRNFGFGLTASFEHNLFRYIGSLLHTIDFRINIVQGRRRGLAIYYNIVLCLLKSKQLILSQSDLNCKLMNSKTICSYDKQNNIKFIS